MNSKKRLRFTVIALFFSMIGFAQQSFITGKVIDESGHPISDVTVTVKGKSLTTSTNEQGIYRVQASASDVLMFSHVGYAELEQKAGNSTLVQLISRSQLLNDIVVIGYGTVRKKDLTGAVANISKADFQKGVVTNAEQLIASKVPGVQVTPISGRPGSGSSFLIRGGASLNASNDPLIVIDGVPVEGWNNGSGFLSQLNPADIESFSVLKDASAAAIYGARASNGVILITTNKGQSGKLRINFSTKYLLSTIIKKVPVLSADEFRQAVKLAALYSGRTEASFGLGTANTDWQNEIYQSATGNDNTLSISGGIKKLPYRFSAGYLNQDGVLKTGNYKRLTALLNLNPVFFNNHLKVNLNLKGSAEDTKVADERAISSAVTFDPTQPVKTNANDFGGYFEYTALASNPAVLHGHYNPVGMLEQVKNLRKTYRSIGNIQLDYKLHFLPDLRININTGYDIAKVSSEYFMPETAFENNIGKGSSFKANPSSEVRNVFWESYFNYVKEITSLKSRIDAIAGYSYNDFLTTNYFYPAYNAKGEEQPNSKPTYPFDKPRHTLISFYGRLNYSLKNKYLLTTTLRRDGSSRFSNQNQWGLFPSAAVAWKISEERFFKNKAFLSDLKLRIGYGVTGQQDGIGNYDFIPTYSLGSLANQYLLGNTFYRRSIPSAADRNRQWEQTATSNIALDYGFFDNRIAGSIDVYLKKTTNLLNTINVPLGTDFTSSITKNIGSMENSGVEFLIKAEPIKRKDLMWNTAFNFTFNKNKITKLSPITGSDVGLFSGSYLVNTVGYSRNIFYLYKQAYDKDGKPLEEIMVDANKDGKISDPDRYRSYSSIPKYLMGFSSDLRYKNLSFSFAAHSNIGQYMYYQPQDNLVAIYGWQVPTNLSTSYNDTRFKMSTNQAQKYSDYYLQNASFLKLDNISFGYVFKDLMKKVNPTALLRLNVSIQNVFVLTKYTGQDPEASFNWGVDFGGNYPIPRTYSLGLSLDF